jgi:2,3-bisphosphoglycerate-dependent phosphoglycerate mutase
LSKIGDQDIVGVEIPTGQPLVYELSGDLSVEDSYYLNER